MFWCDWFRCGCLLWYEFPGFGGWADFLVDLVSVGWYNTCLGFWRWFLVWVVACCFRLFIGDCARGFLCVWLVVGFVLVGMLVWVSEVFRFPVCSVWLVWFVGCVWYRRSVDFGLVCLCGVG